MTFKVMSDGVEIDWSGVNVMVDGQLAGAVYVHGEKVWPVEAPPAVDQVMYLADWSSVFGGPNPIDVLRFPVGGPYVTPDYLGLSLGQPFAMAVAPDGTLYIVDVSTGLVHSWDGTTDSVVPLTIVGASGVAVDTNGILYVVDQTGKKVISWNGTTQSTLGLTGMNTPYGVAVGADGTVYVSDQLGKKVYSWDGSTQSTIGFTGLKSPTGLAVAADGTVYVADGGAKKVYSRKGSTQSTIGFTGLVTPVALAIDADGIVYVNDQGNYTVKSWDGTTQTAIFGSKPDHPIFGIAIGPAQP